MTENHSKVLWSGFYSKALACAETALAKNAKLVLPEQRCHTCSKFGSARQYNHAREVFSLYFSMIVEIAYQRLSANPQAAVLLQGLSLLSASSARNIKPPAMRVVVI